MSGFGGTIKLTGEDAYRKALKGIADDLKVVAANQKLTAATYDSSDKSMTALAARSSDLNTKLEAQSRKVETLKNALKDYQSQQEKAKTVLDQHVTKLNAEKQKLAEVEAQYGKNSKQYKEQAQVVQALEEKVSGLTTQYERNESKIKTSTAQLATAQAEYKKTENALADLAADAKSAGVSSKDLGIEVEASGKKVEKANEGYTVWKNTLANLASQVITKTVQGVKSLVSTLGEWSDMSDALKEQEMKLTQVMHNTTDATDEYIQGIIDLTAQEEKRGIISQEAQLAGLQELGTYISQKETLEKLLPVMNDMVAQQYGLGASMESSANIATMMGKVMGNGQVDALSRLGYKFDETQKQLLKFGTEEERVATLAEVVNQSVEGVNYALAQTDAGKAAIAASYFDDLKKSAGETFSEMKNKVLIGISGQILPKLQDAVARVKDALNKVDWEKFGKQAGEALEKLVDGFEWLLANGDKVAKVLTAVVAALAVAKIVSFVSGISSAITAVGGLSAAMHTLTAAMAANPILAVTAAVVGLAAVLGTVIEKNIEASKTYDALEESLNRNHNALIEDTKAWDELRTAQEESLAKSNGELDYYQKLADELATLVDENGKVKEGYETRASFIMTTLNKALGLEMSLTDGVIDGYQGIQDQISKIIEQKKAQYKLEAQEALYNKALEEQSTVLERIAELRDNIQEAIQKGDLAEALDLSTELSKQESLFNQYVLTISEYETNLGLFTQGKYDEMKMTLTEYSDKYESTTDAIIANIDKQLEEENNKKVTLLDLQHEYGDERYKNELETTNKTIENLMEEKKKYVSTIKDEQSEANEAIKTGADAAQKELEKKETEYQLTGAQLIRKYKDGILEEESPLIQASAKVGEGVLGAFGIDDRMLSQGAYAVGGFIIGMRNRISEAMSTAREIANGVVNRIKSTLGIQSPSKVMKEFGAFTVEGFQIGMKAEEGDALAEAHKFGEGVVNAIGSELTGKAMTALQTAVPKEFSTNVAVNTSKMLAKNQNTGIVGQLKEALNGVDVVLDDQKVGTFIDKTVTDLVYNV